LRFCLRRFRCRYGLHGIDDLSDLGLDDIFLKKCSNSPCTIQTNRLKYSMQNNNTLTKKGETIMDFDNGIFCTVPDDTMEGVVWIVRKADGERITFCRGFDDVMFCVAELMKQRIAR
tara:strand:+ start:295 stop:645 length:351 start_codon:yes stop_codon:yes gene_type:complete